MRRFLVAGLLVTLVLAGAAGAVASSAPDGLEKVADEHGFAATEEAHALEDSPVAGYAVDGIDDERVSTGLAGVAGVVVTFGVATALFLVVRRRPSPTR